MTITSACPKCRKQGADRKGNNLVEYANNSFCHACGYNLRRRDLEFLDKQLNGQVTKQHSGLKTTKLIPPIAMKWLLKYNLTIEEMSNFSWNEERKLLVLYSDDTYWQARNFNEAVESKYLSQGIKPNIYYGLYDLTTFVYVEDIISAIKVGRVATACPMLSGMPVKSTESYAKQFKSVYIWNDKDLVRKGLKTARNMSERIGKQVKLVVSENDPKEYKESEIRQYLGIDIQ